MAKRKRSLLIFSMIAVFCLGTMIGSASTYSKKITAWFYPIRVNVDGVPVSFSSPAFIYNNYTYVPIQDIAKHLNLGTRWNNNSKRLDLLSNEGGDLSVSALRSELDRKNLEVSNLNLKVSQLETQLNIQKEDKYSSGSGSSNNDKLRDLQDILEERYDRHRNNGRTLRFKSYRLSQLVDDTIRIRMYGDFRRGSSEWREAKISEFEDFLDDICQEVNRKFKDNMEIIVYDEDNSKIAEYSYEQRKDKLKKEYFYSSSGGSGKDKGSDLDDLEEMLEEDFYNHRNNNRTLGFETYELTKLSGGDIHVKMYGEFRRDDREWEDLNKSHFEDFLESICRKINKDFEKDIEIVVYDRNNHIIAEYGYELNRKRLYQKYFYNR